MLDNKINMNVDFFFCLVVLLLLRQCFCVILTVLELGI